MSSFFKGWRRKAGCALLVIACTFAGIWLRSEAVFDVLCIPLGQNRITFESNTGSLCFCWELWKDRDTWHLPRWETVDSSRGWIDPMRPYWKLEFGEFESLVFTDDARSPSEIVATRLIGPVGSSF